MPYPPRRPDETELLVAGSMGEEVGFALRRARLARGLTLKQVGERSAGAFKPTAVACYERAERTISLERFYELCGFYGVAPVQMLAEIEAAVGGRDELIVDLTRLEDSIVTSPPDG